MRLSERIKTAIKSRSDHSLSYDGVLSADWGDLVPIACFETVPTDRLTVQGQVFMRLANLASPTYGRIHCFVNHFYVPNRILMPEYAFEDSITGGQNGDAPERFPFITYAALYDVYSQLNTVYGSGSSRRFLKLLTYFGHGPIANALLNSDWDGLTTRVDDEAHSISFLPFAALFRIYADYYYPFGLEEDDGAREILSKKREGLLSSSSFVEDDEPLSELAWAFASVSACYQKDYFTTAFTRPQRGSAAVVPVSIASGSLNPGLAPNDTGSGISASGMSASGDTYNEVYSEDNGQATGVNTNIIGQFEAHAQRWAQSIQAFLERNNIAGGRYFEQMLARFGVKMRNEELQRSQYIGGNDFWVNVGDVTRTTSTEAIGDVQQGLGSQAGKGISLGKDTVSYTADEYGFFITLFHFCPETGFPMGLSKMWTRRSRFDYWTPELEDTGMQPVYNKELNEGLTTTLNLPAGNSGDGVFGYVPRYAEYKFSNPILGGDFVLGNGIYSQALCDSYHLYRLPKSDDEIPVLNSDFVRISSGYDEQQEGDFRNNYNRVFQQTDGSKDHFFVNVQMSIGANRPMLGYAESGLEFANDNGGSSVEVPYAGVRL